MALVQVDGARINGTDGFRKACGNLPTGD
jgi:hypothetical protein